MGSYGITIKQSEYGLDLLDLLIVTVQPPSPKLSLFLLTGTQNK